MKAVGAVILAATLLAGCGGFTREMQSLTVIPSTATAQNGQMQFTATGQFNQAPLTVTPVAVAWFQSSPPFHPSGDPVPFTVTDQPFTAKCTTPGMTMNVIAFAPMNAAGSNGTIPLQVFLNLTVKHTTSQEDGFVAATAKLTCP